VVNSSLDNVNKLLQFGFGDKGRLEDLEQRLRNGRTLYNSDIQYLQKLVNLHDAEIQKIKETKNSRSQPESPPEPKQETLFGEKLEPQKKLSKIIEQNYVCLNCANITLNRFMTKKRKSTKKNDEGLEFFRFKGKEFCKLCDMHLAKGYWKEISDTVDGNQYHSKQELCVGCLVRYFLFDFLHKDRFPHLVPSQEVLNAESMMIIYSRSDDICGNCDKTRKEIKLVIK
jgi:hypothetical protein